MKRLTLVELLETVVEWVVSVLLELGGEISGSLMFIRRSGADDVLMFLISPNSNGICSRA